MIQSIEELQNVPPASVIEVGSRADGHRSPPKNDTSPSEECGSPSEDRFFSPEGGDSLSSSRLSASAPGTHFPATFMIRCGPKKTDLYEIHSEMAFGATVADGKELLSTSAPCNGFLIQFTRDGTVLCDDEKLDARPCTVEPVVSVKVDCQMITVNVFQGTECRSMGHVLERLQLHQAIPWRWDR
jgi:hypothetical protein